MRLASFNIRGAHLDRQKELPRLAEACAALDADVLGLQEVDRRRRRSGFVDQAAYLAERLGGVHVYGPTRPRSVRGQFGNALIVRGTLDDVEVRVLPGTGTQQPRAAVLARAEVGGMKVSVAVTHLQHHSRRRSHLSDEAPGQLRALLRWLGEREAPRVLIGDLNLQPPRAEPMLADAGFTIAATGPAYPSGGPTMQLDYLAVDGLVIDAASVVPTGDVSDHHAIVADVRSVQ